MKKSTYMEPYFFSGAAFVSQTNATSSSTCRKTTLINKMINIADKKGDKVTG